MTCRTYARGMVTVAGDHRSELSYSLFVRRLRRLETRMGWESGCGWYVLVLLGGLVVQPSLFRGKTGDIGGQEALGKLVARNNTSRCAKRARRYVQYGFSGKASGKGENDQTRSRVEGPEKKGDGLGIAVKNPHLRRTGLWRSC